MWVFACAFARQRDDGVLAKSAVFTLSVSVRGDVFLPTADAMLHQSKGAAVTVAEALTGENPQDVARGEKKN